MFAEDEKRDWKGSTEVTQTHTQKTTNPAIKPEGEMTNTKEAEGVESSHTVSSKDEGDTEVTATGSTIPPLPQDELRMRRLKHLEQ